MSKQLSAISIAPRTREWLNNTRQARVLQVFKPVCNLINERDEVLSLVTKGVGNGPFAAVVGEINFQEGVKAEAQVKVDTRNVQIGPLRVQVSEAVDWQPRPDWEGLRKEKERLEGQIEVLTKLLKSFAPRDSFAVTTRAIFEGVSLETKLSQVADGAIGDLFEGIQEADIKKLDKAAGSLAGLGPGLTPAGDDFLMGVMLGLWAIKETEGAESAANSLAHAAAGRTTALSAAWLRAAAAGEVAEVWQDLFDCLLNERGAEVETVVRRILNTGHTSGADALAGFLACLNLGREGSRP